MTIFSSIIHGPHRVFAEWMLSHSINQDIQVESCLRFPDSTKAIEYVKSNGQIFIIAKNPTTHYLVDRCLIVTEIQRAGRVSTLNPDSLFIKFYEHKSGKMQVKIPDLILEQNMLQAINDWCLSFFKQSVALALCLIPTNIAFVVILKKFNGSYLNKVMKIVLMVLSIGVYARIVQALWLISFSYLYIHNIGQWVFQLRQYAFQFPALAQSAELQKFLISKTS